ncbi:hypothetical protein CVT24_012522 [Panaeolus cyanescens]|uniref:Hemerythrin-like domain-containing protein n=1 Tax=Panaeolus cyanescens TaxID=181874 RepID=A0A409YK25_9AGAR|nr:hypothetical protein CVT24_012522 [Panaeolus cyanescens]
MASESTTGPYSLIPLPEDLKESKNLPATIRQLAPTPSFLFLKVSSLDMSMIHNVFIRALNSIHLNAPKVTPLDMEEETMFPVLEKKIAEISHNVEQHKAFHDGMDAFKQYILDVKAKKETYDGEKAAELCKEFAKPMVQHLHDEIPTISPENLSRFDDEPETLQNMYRKVEEHIKSQPGKLTVFPFVMTHHDFKKAPNWPPVPAPIRWFARNIAPHWNSSYWKFSPYTSRGESQTYNPAIMA